MSTLTDIAKFLLNLSEPIVATLFQEGVAILLRVTRDDSWLTKAVANTYSRLNVSIGGGSTGAMGALAPKL